MSQENVDVVREGFRRFEAGDVESLAELYAPDAIVFAPEGWPEVGPFVGREAVMAQFTRLMEDWTDNRPVWLDATAAGEWVVVRFDWHVRGAESGLAGRLGISGAYRIADGKIAEVHFTWDYAQALEAAGRDRRAVRRVDSGNGGLARRGRLRRGTGPHPSPRQAKRRCVRATRRVSV